MDSIERFIFILLIIILYFQFNNNCNNSNQQGLCDLRPCNRLLKRDFKYCMFIMLTLLILLLTVKLGNDQNLFAFISFGSTLTSIILSVLAIFMTMLAESKNDATKTRLENLTTVIEKSSSTIEKQVENINKIYNEMSSRFSLYENILKQQNQLMDKMKILEEHTKNIEDGIQKKNFGDKGQDWDSNKKIVRDKDGDK